MPFSKTALGYAMYESNAMQLHRLTRRYQLLIGVLVLVCIGGGLYSTRRLFTPPPHPLGSVDVEALLIQSGDFAPDIVVRRGQVPAYIQEFNPPAAEYQVTRLLETAWPGTGSGSIVVFRYASPQARTNAYTKLTYIPLMVRLLGTPAEPVVGLGEQSQLVGPNALGSVYVVFQRCDAIVHFQYDIAPLYNTSIDVETLLAYGKRLDVRLQQALCP